MSNRKQHGWWVGVVTPLGGREEPAWRCSLEAAVTEREVVVCLRQKMGAVGPNQDQARFPASVSTEVTAGVTGAMSSLCRERVCKAQPRPEDTHSEGTSPAEETCQPGAA